MNLSRRLAERLAKFTMEVKLRFAGTPGNAGQSQPPVKATAKILKQEWDFLIAHGAARFALLRRQLRRFAAHLRRRKATGGQRLT